MKIPIHFMPSIHFTPTIARDLVASAIARGLIHPSVVPPMPDHIYTHKRILDYKAAGLTARGTPRKQVVRTDPELAGLHGPERARMLAKLWRREHRQGV